MMKEKNGRPWLAGEETEETRIQPISIWLCNHGKCLGKSIPSQLTTPMRFPSSMSLPLIFHNQYAELPQWNRSKAFQPMTRCAST